MKNVNSIVSLLFIFTFAIFVQVCAQGITNTPEQQSAVELDSNTVPSLEERDANTDVIVPEIKQDDAPQNEQSTFLIGHFISYAINSIIVYAMIFLGIHFIMHINLPLGFVLLLLLIVSCFVLSCIQFSSGYNLYAIGNIIAFLISLTLYIVSICFCPL